MNNDIQGDVVPKPPSTDENAKPRAMENTSEEECQICLLPFNNMTTIVPCMHSYCYDCLQEWRQKPMDIGRSSTCCICRQPICEVRHSFTPTGDFQVEHFSTTQLGYHGSLSDVVGARQMALITARGGDVIVRPAGHQLLTINEVIEAANIAPQGIQPVSLGNIAVPLAESLQGRTRMSLSDLYSDWQLTLNLTNKALTDPGLDGDLQEAVEAATIVGAGERITRRWQTSLHELAGRAAPDMSSVQDSMSIWGMIERLLVFQEDFRSTQARGRIPISDHRCCVALLTDMIEKTLEYYQPAIGTFSATLPTMGFYAHVLEDLNHLYLEMVRGSRPARGISLKRLLRQDLLSVARELDDDL